MKASQQDAAPSRRHAHFASSSESEDTGAEGTSVDSEEDVSEVSAVDSGEGFLDEEAVEASANEEEMEWEREGCESEDEESEDWSSDGEGFILEEAKDKALYHPAKKRRVAGMEGRGRDSSSGCIEQSSTEDEVCVEDVSSNSEELEDSSGSGGEEAGSSGSGGEEADSSGSGGGEDGSSGSEDGSSGSGGEEADSSGSGGGEDGSSGSEDGSSGRVEDEVGGQLRWKEGLQERARVAFEQHRSSSASLRRLIYGDSRLVEEEEAEESGERATEELGGLFHVAKQQAVSVFHREDCTYPLASLTQDWSKPATVAAVKSLFVTGSWGSEDAQALLEADSEVYGDFEDLETGHKSKTAVENSGGKLWLWAFSAY